MAAAGPVLRFSVMRSSLGVYS